MDFKERLEALLADPSSGSLDDIIKDINRVQEKAATAEELIKEVQGLENKLNEAGANASKYNNTFGVIKDTFGITDGDIDVDVLNAKIAELKGKGGNEADVKNLEDTIQALKSESDNKSKDYEEKLFDLKLNNSIYQSGHEIKATGSRAYDIIIQELKKDATFNESGAIVYKRDGAIERKDGLPISIADKISMLKANDDFNGLFKTDAIGGSGESSVSNAASTGTAPRGSIKELEQRMIESGLKI